MTSPEFYLCRPNRPALIVNTNILQDYTIPDSAQIPVQASPIATSVPGQSPDGTTIVGGGGVESFAFTSTLTGAGTGGTAAVTITRRYSLCDIAGCSSAFFAAFILQYLNQEIDTIIHDLKWPGWIAAIVKTVLTTILDFYTSDLIPKYNYWQLREVGQSNPANLPYGFSDGGDFDNSGILGMLAQTDANAIVAFVNTDVPLSENSGSIVVDPSIPLLFGYQETLLKNGQYSGQYVPFKSMSPSEPMSYVKVFSDAKGEFAALRQGLYDASCGGSAAPGKATAWHLQKLTTVNNPVANIKAGREVRVLWVHNNRVDNWQNAIPDTGPNGIRADLRNGQQAQPTGPLAYFPSYPIVELYLDPEAVNMLAQLCAWNVQQLQTEILDLLG